MQPDVWDSAVNAWFTLAKGGGVVNAAVSWGKGFDNSKFMNSFGQVTSFETPTERGLQGTLQGPVKVYPEAFHKMELKITQPLPGPWGPFRKTTATVTTLDTGETKTLDDPFGGPWWATATSWIFQVWPRDEGAGEYIDLWLINQWAASHLVRMFSGIAWMVGDEAQSG
jgi:hypothetical protein